MVNWQQIRMLANRWHEILKYLFLLYEYQLAKNFCIFYFTFVVWLEPLFDEDPFVTDDVVTVMEGATRDL